MLIHSIEINNFRQFYGKNKINLSTDAEKNITLIHAENGVGKTALLNAILWCFFEKTTENFQRPKELLNHVAKDSGEKGFFVFIEFEEDGERYVAQRTVNSINGLTFRIYNILGTGVHQEIDNAEIFINSIIPKDMAGYFFFQGEGVGALASGQGGDVKQAIRDILGFTIAEQALKDISKVKTEYRKELQRLDNSSELGKIQMNLADCEENIGKLDEDIQVAETNRKFVASKLRAIESELRNSDVSVVSEKQKNRDSKIEELQRFKGVRDRALSRKANLVGRYAVCAFGAKMAKAGIDFIDDKELKGSIPAPYNVQLVKDILEKETCICGAEVKHGSDAFGCIQSLLAKAADPVLINRVRRARSQLTVIRKDMSSAKADFCEVIDEISRSEEAIVNVKADMERLSLEIQGVDFDEIKEKEATRINLFHQLQEANKLYGSLTERKGKWVDSASDYTAKEKNFKSTEPAVVRLQNLMEFIKEMEDELDYVLRKAEDSSILILAEKINKFLDLYVKQDFRAKITPDFEIVLHDREKRPVAHSDGQALLLSLTFISSLISLAKERSAASGAVLTPGAVAPFIIDAPFGVLDNTYKANIAEEIPKSVNQVVFLLSSSHWEGTVENAIRKRIGYEYNLVLEVEAAKGNKEDGAITVLGKRHDTVRYSSDADRTTIEEIGCYV